MRIAITGASGNVGTALLRRLSATSHDVVGVSRRTPPAQAPYDRAEWIDVDLAAHDAAATLTTAFTGAEVVIHLAWQLQPSHDRDAMRRTNQGGTRAVVEAVQNAGVAHLVHISSLGAYAPAARGVWADETWPTTGVPSSPYSVDKAAGERIVAAERNFKLAVVRPALVLQADAASEISRYFLGPLVPAALLRPSLMRIAPWPREFTVQVVSADDVADALVRIVEQGAVGAFNLAAAPVLDRAQLKHRFGGLGFPPPLGVVRTAAQVSWRLHLQPTEGGWVDLGASVPLLDSARARTELGWDPVHRGDDLLAEFLTATSQRRGIDGPLLHRRPV